MSLVRGVRICPKNVQRSWTGPNHSLNVPALDLQRECVQKCLAAFSEENSAELEDTTAAFWAATANLGFDSESLKVCWLSCSIAKEPPTCCVSSPPTR